VMSGSAKDKGPALTATSLQKREATAVGLFHSF